MKISQAIRKLPPRRMRHDRGLRPKVEGMEARQLLATGFLQGFAYVDTNANGTFDAGDAAKSGATIQLRSADGSALLASTTTDSTGYYLFDGVAPGTYRLREVAPGFVTTGVEIRNTINPASAIGTEIQVTVVDPALEAIQVDRQPDPLASARAQFTVTGGPFNALTGNPPGDTVHQYLLNLSQGTLNSTRAIYSFCTDLFHGLTPNASYVVQPGTTPTAPVPTFNAGRVAYLYNTYGTQFINDATRAAGLQLATWELIYDSSPDLNAGNFQLVGTNDPAIVAAANAFLADSAGKSQRAYFLNDLAPVGTAGSQGMITTEKYSFANTPARGNITGTKFLDVSGNGLTADDTPFGEFGVTFQLFSDANNNGVLDAGDGSPVATTATTSTDAAGSNSSAVGTYQFNNLAPGTYFVKEVVPAGYVRTEPVLSDYRKVVVTAQATSSGNDFADAEKCDKSILTNIVYTINGCRTVTDLRGNVHQGDTVKVSFTVRSGFEPHQFSLVSYTAPGSSFDASKASQQRVYDLDTGTFGPGRYSLTVEVPDCFFQIDFVCGPPIDKFGPANSNIFYTPQDRLFSADNGGTCACDKGLDSGDTATIGFWANKNGQALIKSLNGGQAATQLATWLKSNFPNLYGAVPNLVTNADVAAYFKQLKGATGTKLEAQVLAAALAVYVTDFDLAGTVASPYGFHVSLDGTGAKTVNVGSNGSSIGLINNKSYTILDILKATNAANANNTLFGGSTAKRSAANAIFDGINQAGDITG